MKPHVITLAQLKAAGVCDVRCATMSPRWDADNVRLYYPEGFTIAEAERVASNSPAWLLWLIRKQLVPNPYRKDDSNEA